jgi:hypothetical protein
MSYTTVAELRSALGVGQLYSDATLQEVCDAADNVLIPFLWSNTTSIIAHSNKGTTGTLYVQDASGFYVGQTINITGSGSHFNGSKTITAVGVDFVQVTTNHVTDTPKHPINPYGTITAESYTDYATIPAVQTASLLIAEAIWQARQAPSGQAMSVDGFTPSPFAMSNTLVARIRGLIAPYLDPRSMVH